MQIPTLYSSIQELYLDIAIYGKIVSSRARNKDELKEVLFEEFKLSHPLPTLELKRYELSDKVSNDYSIGDEKLELCENEGLIDLTKDDIVFDIPDSFEEISEDIRVLYNYENRVTDELRKKYLSFGIEEYSGDSSVLGTIKKVEDNVLTDDEIEQLETGNFNRSGGIELEEDEAEDDYGYEIEDESEEDYDYEIEDEEAEDDYEYEIEEDDEAYEYEVEDEEESYGYEVEEDDEDAEAEAQEVEFTEEVEDRVEEVVTEVQEVEVVEEVAPPQRNMGVDTSSEDTSSTEKSDIVEEEPSIDDVPKDLRQFLRKYPRCDIKFALRYFSKKEIDKAILIGKIVRRGNKLHI